MNLKSVGIVISKIRKTKEMPIEGIRAKIRVYNEFADALDNIEENSHIIVIGWFAYAERMVLKARRRKIKTDTPLKGVFALRSPARPNPLGISVCRLVKRNGNLLTVDNLDFIDSTEIVDIKPYSAGWDMVFSARSKRDTEFFKGSFDRQREEASLLREVVAFHGVRCNKIKRGIKILVDVMVLFETTLKDSRIRVEIGDDPCLNDLFQGATLARFGSRRLKISGDNRYRLKFQGKIVEFDL